MVKVALGVLGVPLLDFLQWTVNDYFLAITGYQIKRKDQWEMVRMQSYYSLVAMQGSKGITYDDIRVPTDEKESYKDKKRVKWRKVTA